MQLARRVIDVIALAERIQAVALPGMQLARQRERIEHLTQPGDLPRFPRQPGKLGIEKCDIESRVVNHELSAADEHQQLLGDLGEARLPVEIGARDTVHRDRPVVDLAFGVQVAMEGATARPAVDELDAADLDDAVIELGLESRGLGVEYDLAHGARVYRNAWLAKASIARLASRSTRSFPGTPACAGTQCHSIRWPARSSSNRCQRSWFFTGLRSAVRQPRAFQAASHSVMPRRTYSESVYTRASGRFSASRARM